MLKEAIAILEQGNGTCVVMQGGDIVYEGAGLGVKPLLQLYNTAPEKLKGALVADKVIGKAAAVILVLAGAAEVYGSIMSEKGKEYLMSHHIKCSYKELVPFIINRRGDDMCPLEKSVKDIHEPQMALGAIKAKIDELMKIN